MALLTRQSNLVVPLVVGFLFVLASAGAAIILTAQQRSAGVWLRQAFEIQTDLASVRNLASQAETGQRGFLIRGAMII